MSPRANHLATLQPDIPVKVLFLCTHNRCRSIIAEAIGRQIGGGLLTVASAGSEPAGAVHPMALWYLQQHGIATDGLASKSIDSLAFDPDIVITLCDHAALETCPLWLDRTPRVHWGIADPSALVGDDTICRKAFDDTILLLHARIAWLCEAIDQGLDHASLLLLIRTLAHITPSGSTKAA
ncbi:MAG TPA: arsenate reductase ArsC [Pseudomonadales bacterium]